MDIFNTLILIDLDDQMTKLLLHMLNFQKKSLIDQDFII